MLVTCGRVKRPHALEPCAERVSETAGRLAVVELQQFCFGQGNGGGVRKAHGQDSTDRGYPLRMLVLFDHGTPRGRRRCLSAVGWETQRARLEQIEKRVRLPAHE